MGKLDFDKPCNQCGRSLEGKVVIPGNPGNSKPDFNFRSNNCLLNWKEIASYVLVFGVLFVGSAIVLNQCPRHKPEVVVPVEQKRQMEQIEQKSQEPKWINPFIKEDKKGYDNQEEIIELVSYDDSVQYPL